MKIELVVFDIAGTTVVDNNNVNDAFRGAFEKAGYPVALKEVNYVMGYRKIEAIKILLEKFYPEALNNEILIHEIHDQFNDDMYHFYLTTTTLKPMPGAEAIFNLLHLNQIKIGLDTGFPKLITNTIIERLGWVKNGLVDMVISSDEVNNGRPSAEMIHAIMTQLAVVNTQQVAKVGDTEVDILEGRNADCGLVVSVTTGSYKREELQPYTPDHIIDSLSELSAILNLKH